MNVIQTAIPGVLIVEPRWNNRNLAIEWPTRGKPLLSAMDTGGAAFNQTETFE
jgi:hypothetical protein